jgi:beta-N-acetylhexosaminidase
LNGLERPHGIGLFIAADCEGGTVQRPYGEGTTLIPPAAAQGQWSNLDLQSAALVWGEELISQGVNLNLAPVTDTVPADNMRANEPIGALGRAFSDNPDVVSEKAKAFILGMQGAGVGTSIKHFPGLGRIKGNTDFTTNGITDSQTTVGDDFVSAFSDALAANPTSVMISLATYTNIDPTTPAVFSPVVIDDLLRRQLGWNGLVIADSLGAAAVANTPADQLARRFVQAGGDISIIPGLGEATAAHAGLVAAINSDPAFAAKVDIAVARVLRSKLDAGLLTLAAIDIAARPTCATPITPEDSRTIVSNANLANRGGRPWQMSC